MAKWKYWLGPWPNARKIRLRVYQFFWSVFSQPILRVFGHELGGAFPAWYVAGIRCDHPHEQLYDLQLQQRLQHDLLPR